MSTSPILPTSQEPVVELLSVEQEQFQDLKKEAEAKKFDLQKLLGGIS